MPGPGDTPADLSVSQHSRTLVGNTSINNRCWYLLPKEPQISGAGRLPRDQPKPLISGWGKGSESFRILPVVHWRVNEGRGSTYPRFYWYKPFSFLLLHFIQNFMQGGALAGRYTFNMKVDKLFVGWHEKNKPEIKRRVAKQDHFRSAQGSVTKCPSDVHVPNTLLKRSVVSL